VSPLEMFQDSEEEKQWEKPGYGCRLAISRPMESRQGRKTNHINKHAPRGRVQGSGE
jgi:hypothetical protein